MIILEIIIHSCPLTSGKRCIYARYFYQRGKKGCKINFSEKLSSKSQKKDQKIITLLILSIQSQPLRTHYRGLTRDTSSHAFKWNRNHCDRYSRNTGQLGCASILLLHMHTEFYRGLSVDATESGRFLYRQNDLYRARARVSRQCNFKFAMRRSVIKVV